MLVVEVTKCNGGFEAPNAPCALLDASAALARQLAAEAIRHVVALVLGSGVIAKPAQDLQLDTHFPASEEVLSAGQ